MSAPVRKVVVLGAGAAGLCAGFALRDRGVDVTVLEAAPHAGGKLRSVRKDGFLLETGAVGLLDREGDLAPLCARLGVQLLPANAAARARYVERDGVVHRLGPGLLRARELPGLSRLLFTSAEPRAGETVAAYFERRLGSAGGFLADALQTGIYAGDPSRLEARSAFPSLGRKRRRGRLSSFAGGLQDLVSGFVRSLGPALRLNARVRAVLPGLGDGNPGHRVLLDDGELSCDAIVCALPAPDAAALFPAAAAGLRALEAAPLALVHFGVPIAAAGRYARSFGVLSPGRPVCGVLFPAALWPGRAPEGHSLVTAIAGGARYADVPSLGDAALEQVARDHLRRALSIDAGAPLGITRWPLAVPQPLPGHGARIDALERLLPGRVLFAGAWYRGVSVLDCLRQGLRTADALAR